MKKHKHHASNPPRKLGEVVLLFLTKPKMKPSEIAAVTQTSLHNVVSCLRNMKFGTTGRGGEPGRIFP